jgi:hypothetical protein
MVKVLIMDYIASIPRWVFYLIRQQIDRHSF